MKFEDTNKYNISRIKHFQEWLNMITVELNVPDNILEIILVDLQTRNIHDTSENVITENLIKSILKQNKLNKYYELIPSIRNKICNKPVIIISDDIKNKIISMFISISKVYQEKFPTNGFLPYFYVLYKIFEILDNKQFIKITKIDKIDKITKSIETLQRYDDKWSIITNELGWEFIKTE